MSNKKMHNIEKKFTHAAQSLIVQGIGQGLNLFDIYLGNGLICICINTQHTGHTALHCKRKRITV